MKVLTAKAVLKAAPPQVRKEIENAVAKTFRPDNWSKWKLDRLVVNPSADNLWAFEAVGASRGKFLGITLLKTRLKISGVFDSIKKAFSGMLRVQRLN